MLKSDFKSCGGVNSPLLIFLILFSALSHFILAGMIMFPNSKNHQTDQSLTVSFYRIDNAKNSKNTKQTEAADTIDKEQINKKEEKANKELKTEKYPEKNIERKTSEKGKDNIKKSENDEYKTPANNENSAEVATERFLSRLTLNDERKREISERRNFNVKPLNNLGSSALAGQAVFAVQHSQAVGTEVMCPTYLPSSGWCYPLPKTKKNSWNNEEKKKYLQYIRKKITSRIKYPPVARRRGIEGEVLVSFNIKKDGTFEKIEITKKSPYSILNDAVLKAVEKVVVKEKPKEKVVVNIPINFTLK